MSVGVRKKTEHEITSCSWQKLKVGPVVLLQHADTPVNHEAESAGQKYNFKKYHKAGQQALGLLNENDRGAQKVLQATFFCP